MNLMPDQSKAACPWFPGLECDEACFHLGCGNQGLLMHMIASGIPQSEIGGPTDFIPKAQPTNDHD